MFFKNGYELMQCKTLLVYIEMACGRHTRQLLVHSSRKLIIIINYLVNLQIYYVWFSNTIIQCCFLHRLLMKLSCDDNIVGLIVRVIISQQHRIYDRVLLCSKFHNVAIFVRYFTNKLNYQD